MRRSGPWLLALVVWGVAFRSLGEGLVQASRDLYAHDFPESWYLAQRWSRLELPLWLPHARLGQPFLALLYTQALYPPRVLTSLLWGPVLGPNVMHALHAAWGFAGLYLAARRLGLGRWAAFAGAAPFSLSPFFVEFAQNLSFASTASWAGWGLLAAEHLRRRPGPVSATWLGVALGGAFHAGAPEIWTWELLLAALWVASPRPSVRRLAWFAAAVLLAAGLAAVVALPAAELARASTRPGELPAGRLEWSLSWAQLVAMVIPDADRPRQGPYWGGVDQRFLFSLFIGSAAGLFALGSATRRRARAVLALLLVCAALALGKSTPVSEALLQLPPFRLFRYPAKYAVGALFALSLLSGVGLQRLRAMARRRSPWALHVVLGGVGAFAGLFLAARGGRSGAQLGSTWALVVVAIAAAALLLLRRRAGPFAAGLVALELLAAPHERWPRLPARALRTPSSIAAALRADGAGRVSIRVDMDDAEPAASGPWDEAGEGERIVLTSRERLSGLRFIEEDLRATGGYGFRDPWRLAAAFQHRAGASAVSGVTHFVRNTDDSPRFPGPTPWSLPQPDVWVWRWAGALPRGRVVQRARVGSDEEGFAALAAPVSALAEEVVVERGDALRGTSCPSTVTTTDERPERVRQVVDACADGYLLLADAWYPGWTVTVDGVAQEIVRAWGFLRAVRVAPGHHEVLWEYRPWSVRLGGWVSALSAAGALGVLVGGRARRRNEAGGRTRR
jgi:hypothetical protein